MQWVSIVKTFFFAAVKYVFGGSEPLTVSYCDDKV